MSDSSGSGAGGGGGYNIPVSLSAASTYSVPQTVNAPYTVVFGSANKTGGDTEVSPVNYNPATAVASAALGGDSNAQAGAQGLTQAAGLLSGGGSTNKYLLYGGIALAVVAVALVAYKVVKG